MTWVICLFGMTALIAEALEVATVLGHSFRGGLKEARQCIEVESISVSVKIAPVCTRNNSQSTAEQGLACRSSRSVAMLVLRKGTSL
jgi:hypothetical protein